MTGVIERGSERGEVDLGESGREKTQPNQGNQTPTHIGSDELERGTGGLEIDWEGLMSREERNRKRRKSSKTENV